MFCVMRKAMAAGHCSVIIRPPKPMVTWTSMENRKADEKDLEVNSNFNFTPAQQESGSIQMWPLLKSAALMWGLC